MLQMLLENLRGDCIILLNENYYEKFINKIHVFKGKDYLCANL